MSIKYYNLLKIAQKLEIMGVPHNFEEIMGYAHKRIEILENFGPVATSFEKLVFLMNS